MELFLINNYSALTYSFELIAVVSGLIFYKKYKGTHAVFFIKVIIYLFFVELIGSYSAYYDRIEFLKPLYNSVFRNSNWWFTIFFDIGVIFLISIFYQKIIQNIHFKNILKYLTYVYLVFSIGYICVNKDVFFTQMFPVLCVFSGIIILLLCVFFLIELLLSKSVLNFYKSVYFYITVGIFVWWIVITPLTFYDVYMVNSDWDFIVLKWEIYLFLNFFMYTTFAIGLIVSKPEKRA